MPTANNNVKFHFIETSPPNTYNSDTIYFDSINRNIKVGDVTIAASNDRVDVSQYLFNNIVTLISQQKNQYQFYYSILGFDIPLTYCGVNYATFSAILPTDENNAYSFDTLGQIRPSTVIVIVDNSGNVTTNFNPLHSTLIINMPFLSFTSAGTIVTNSNVSNNYGEYANNQLFWDRLEDAAGKGEDIEIVVTDITDCVYKFNNYIYNIDSGNILNFGQILYNSLNVYNVEFNFNNQTITQYGKNLTT